MSARDDDVTTDAAESAEWRAREAALAEWISATAARRRAHDDDGYSFAAGWYDYADPPSPSGYHRTPRDAYLAGRRARRAYERRVARGGGE